MKSSNSGRVLADLDEAPMCRPISFAKFDAELERELTVVYKLTPAEHPVMALAIRGLTNEEIAARLGLSRHTVRNRLASCFVKLDVSRRAEAVFVVLARRYTRSRTRA